MSETSDGSDRQPGGEPQPAEQRHSDPPGGGLTRRTLLARGGVGAGGLVVGGAIGYAARGSSTKTVTEPTSGAPSAGAAAHMGSMGASSSSPTVLPLRWFSSADAAVIGAIANRIYPADSHGPAATELGVVNYIDRQLAGAWGSGERMYRQGPFHTPLDSGHGWQYAMTPADAYRIALDAIDAHTKSAYGGKTFDALSASRQDNVLTDMSNDKIATFTTLKGSDFFTMVLQNVKEGVFADPSYGGNRGVQGWELVRWPGDPMAHGDNQYKYVTDYSYYPPGPPEPMVADGS